MHQPLNAFTIHLVALPTQVSRHLARAIKRCDEILLIDQAHQLQILTALLSRLKVESGTIESHQLTLPAYTQVWMLGLDQLALLFN